jgi:hypothetical protein
MGGAHRGFSLEKGLKTWLLGLGPEIHALKPKFEDRRSFPNIPPNRLAVKELVAGGPTDIQTTEVTASCVSTRNSG